MIHNSVCLRPKARQPRAEIADRPTVTAPLFTGMQSLRLPAWMEVLHYVLEFQQVPPAVDVTQTFSIHISGKIISAHRVVLCVCFVFSAVRMRKT